MPHYFAEMKWQWQENKEILFSSCIANQNLPVDMSMKKYSKNMTNHF